MKGFICMAVPKTGLFRKGRSLVDGDGHRCFVRFIELYATRKAAEAAKRKKMAECENFPGGVDVVIIPACIVGTEERRQG
jgi:hypothetical protein